jgi:hypothetical protein
VGLILKNFCAIPKEISVRTHLQDLLSLNCFNLHGGIAKTMAWCAIFSINIIYTYKYVVIDVVDVGINLCSL